MIEPDDREVRQALRVMLSDRIGALKVPTGIYETVRRRHRRRQRAIVGGVLVVAVVAIVVPSVTLADRPTAPPSTERQCAFPGYKPAPGTFRLPAQSSVPGSLGGDAGVVAASLSAGWSALRAGDVGSSLDQGRAAVRMVQRVDGQIVALVSASGLGRRLIAEVWVWGPHVDHLVTMPAGEVRAPTPVHTAYAIGDVLIQGIDVCGSRHIVVATAPGTTGRATWIHAITPQLRAERSTLVVPMRADGIAVFRSDAPDLRIRLERAGRVVWDSGPQSSIIPSPWLRPTEQELDRAAAEASGNGNPDLVRSIVTMQLGGEILPVAQSNPAVLWSGRAGPATVALLTCTLPGGVRFVTAASAVAVGALYDPRYTGLLAPGALERTVLAWRPDESGRSVAVFAVGGVRAEAVLANGTVAGFTLSHGGGVLESRAAVRRVRVYGADDRLMGEQVPGHGLVDVPRETAI
jgi:hypothetical protein